MKIYKHPIVIIVAVLCSSLAVGQESFFQSSKKFPDSENLSQQVISRYIGLSSRYASRGDISGLSDCIKVISDLNTFDLPITNADISSTMGIRNYYLNNYTRALADYLAALETFTENDNISGINTLLNNIAIIFYRVEDYESTLKYLKRALEYSDVAIKSTYSLLKLNIAETETSLKNFDRSMEICLQLYKEYDPSEVEFSLISITGLIINNLNESGKFDEAFDWIERTPDSLFTNAGYLDLLSYCPYAMETYYKMGNWEKVRELGRMVYPPQDEAFIHDLYSTMDLLSRVAIEEKRYNEAIEFEKILGAIEFSRTSYSREELISLLMTDYAFNLDNIVRNKLEKELYINSIKDRTLKRFIFNFLLILAVVSVLIVILLRTRKFRRAFRQELSGENDKLNQVNIEMSDYNNVLEKENALLDTLISVFAHDLINPFQAILGFSRLMITDYDSLDEENITEYTTLLSDTSFQLNQLLINLRNMSLLQDNKGNLKSDMFEVNQVIAGVEQLFNPLVLKKRIKIQKTGDTIFYGYLNREVFESVLRNVLSNAVKFSFEGGRIDIMVSATERTTRIAVRDYGTGMPEETRLKLLSREYLMSNPGTMKEKGSGLGLTICIELLDLFGAKMNIESTEGSGTVIEIEIPSKDE